MKRTTKTAQVTKMRLSEKRGKLLSATLILLVIFELLTLTLLNPEIANAMYPNFPFWLPYFVVISLIANLIYIGGIWQLKRWAVLLSFAVNFSDLIADAILTAKMETMIPYVFFYLIVFRRWKYFS